MNHIFSLKLWSVAAIFLFIFCINARPSTAPPGWDIGMPGEGTVTSEEWEVIATQECGIVTSSSEDYPEAEITPEISCMAHSLDNDPVRIFQFVRNHIKYVPSFGSRQGATATLLTEQGNDLDQASLLLALLSSADPSTDAHYVSASVKYSKTFLSKLLGFNANKTFEVFSDFGIPSSNAGSSVWVTRFWIETTINGTNYILDPAFVQCQWSASVDLSGPMDYDRSDFIASAMTGAQIDSSGGTWIKDVNESNIRSELATLRGNLLSHIRTNYPNARVEDLLGIPEIIPENYTNLPTALSYAQETGTKTSYTGGLLATHYASLRIQHCNIDYTLYASELAGKRMSIFYTGSGNAPQLRLNGELLQTGYGTTNGVGYTITLTVSVPPFQTGDTRSHSRLQKSGFKYVISSDFGAATPELIKQAGHRLGKYREAGMANTSEAVMGESLNLLGLRWLVQIKQQSSMANKATSVFGSKKYAAGFVSQEEGFGVDYPLSRGVAVAQSGANADIIAWLKTTSLMNSALEHGIIEQTSGDVSASSVKMLKLGNSAGDETYYTDDSNWDTIKNLISWYSSSTLSAIEYYVSVGATVILPKHGNRGVGDDWNGVGYIAEGYSWIASLLSGNYSGGASGNQGNIDSTDIQNMISGMEVSILDGLNTRTTAADPVDLTTGAFVHEHVDLALGKTPPKGLNFRRIYSSDARLSEGIMGYGWRHNLDISAKIISESGPIAGTRLPVDFVVGYVASLVRADILKNEQNVKGWMITTLVAQWHMDMMTRNTACFQLPDKTLKFIAMGDGTYSAPPGVTAELSKPNGLYRLTERSGREYRFNNNMLIDSIVDADGNTMSFAYNSQTNLQTVTDSYGRTLTFTYTGERLKKVTDSTGREVVLWYYSPYDNLNFYDDPDGNRWEYKYDDDHQLISMIDPLSQTIISNIYNSVGQVVTQYNNSGEAWEFLVNGYDGIENRPDNGRTTHTFDKNGWVLSIEDAHDNLTQ
ncbi:RHS repeat protein, partial [PVC group bacterium]|nr:RHS repeat protein [PVC group bacterium]